MVRPQVILGSSSMRRLCWRWQSGPLWYALVEFWGISVSSRINDPGAGIGWGFSEVGGAVLSTYSIGGSLTGEHHDCSQAQPSMPGQEMETFLQCGGAWHDVPPAHWSACDKDTGMP